MDIKIGNYSPIKSAGNAAKRAGTTGAISSFADILAAQTEETTSSAPASDIAATAALNNLLALQEISEEDVRKRKLIQQGGNMLDSLEKLRRQLIDGTIPRHTLQDLSRQIALQKQEVADPQLREIIDDIELRAAVELAKLEMAFKA